MSLFINEKGELSKGTEILVRQLLKMLNLDPEVTLGQISGIHNALIRHNELQTDIINRLERIENGYHPKPQSVSDQGIVE